MRLWKTQPVIKLAQSWQLGSMGKVRCANDNKIKNIVVICADCAGSDQHCRCTNKVKTQGNIHLCVFTLLV